MQDQKKKKKTKILHSDFKKRLLDNLVRKQFKYIVREHFNLNIACQ